MIRKEDCIIWSLVRKTRHHDDDQLFISERFDLGKFPLPEGLASPVVGDISLRVLESDGVDKCVVIDQKCLRPRSTADAVDRDRRARLSSYIEVDIRGYGASSKPSGIAQYSKSLMSQECAIVMESLGFTSFFVCAHDCGARVAHKLLVSYPERVRKAIFLDICPALAMYSKTDMEFAKWYFHWSFLIQKSPLPETLIEQNPRRWAEMFMGGRHAGLATFDKQVFEEYVKVLENPDAVHAMCELPGERVGGYGRGEG
jgi:pimeloyl-ACP methyl ester carboxylesterase